MIGISASAKHVAWCFIPIAFLAVSGMALAQSNAANVHPAIGDKPPKELLASDILALPDREQKAWIHGAVSLIIQSTFANNEKRAKCMLDWYFYRGEGKAVVNAYLNDYGQSPATAVVIATFNSACSK